MKKEGSETRREQKKLKRGRGRRSPPFRLRANGEALFPLQTTTFSTFNLSTFFVLVYTALLRPIPPSNTLVSTHPLPRSPRLSAHHLQPSSLPSLHHPSPPSKLQIKMGCGASVEDSAAKQSECLDLLYMEGRGRESPSCSRKCSGGGARTCFP